MAPTQQYVKFEPLLKKSSILVCNYVSQM
uniref:Uncharacterized protein n=1 Tax=Anguilla anguilla TaxID=7936 RepID=A0A0E9R811_ANGAN